VLLLQDLDLKKKVITTTNHPPKSKHA